MKTRRSRTQAEFSCTLTISSFYDELDALLQFNCELRRTAEIGCTLSRMHALPPKLGGKRSTPFLIANRHLFSSDRQIALASSAGIPFRQRSPHIDIVHLYKARGVENRHCSAPRWHCMVTEHLFSLRIGICSPQIGRLHWCRQLGYHSGKGRLIST